MPCNNAAKGERKVVCGCYKSQRSVVGLRNHALLSTRWLCKQFELSDLSEQRLCGARCRHGGNVTPADEIRYVGRTESGGSKARVPVCGNMYLAQTQTGPL